MTPNMAEISVGVTNDMCETAETIWHLRWHHVQPCKMKMKLTVATTVEILHQMKQGHPTADEVWHTTSLMSAWVNGWT